MRRQYEGNSETLQIHERHSNRQNVRGGLGSHQSLTLSGVHQSLKLSGMPLQPDAQWCAPEPEDQWCAPELDAQWCTPEPDAQWCAPEPDAQWCATRALRPARVCKHTRCMLGIGAPTPRKQEEGARRYPRSSSTCDTRHQLIAKRGNPARQPSRDVHAPYCELR